MAIPVIGTNFSEVQQQLIFTTQSIDGVPTLLVWWKGEWVTPASAGIDIPSSNLLGELTALDKLYSGQTITLENNTVVPAALVEESLPGSTTYVPTAEALSIASQLPPGIFTGSFN